MPEYEGLTALPGLFVAFGLYLFIVFVILPRLNALFNG